MTYIINMRKRGLITLLSGVLLFGASGFVAVSTANAAPPQDQIDQITEILGGGGGAGDLADLLGILEGLGIGLPEDGGGDPPGSVREVVDALLDLLSDPSSPDNVVQEVRDLLNTILGLEGGSSAVEALLAELSEADLEGAVDVILALIDESQGNGADPEALIAVLEEIINSLLGDGTPAVDDLIDQLDDVSGQDPSGVVDGLVTALQTPGPGPTSPGTNNSRPNTKITSVRVRGDRVKVKFRANQSNVKFRCKIDGKRFKGCGKTSGKKGSKTYRNLDKGRHKVRVKAISRVNKGTDRSPAKKKFRVKK